LVKSAIDLKEAGVVIIVPGTRTMLRTSDVVFCDVTCDDHPVVQGLCHLATGGDPQRQEEDKDNGSIEHLDDTDQDVKSLSCQISVFFVTFIISIIHSFGFLCAASKTALISSFIKMNVKRYIYSWIT
jgi:hypothetical protein